MGEANLSCDIKKKSMTKIAEKINLTLHLGYPKTGTTSLQNSFFRSLKDHIYLGKVGE